MEFSELHTEFSEGAHCRSYHVCRPKRHRCDDLLSLRDTHDPAATRAETDPATIDEDITDRDQITNLKERTTIQVLQRHCKLQVVHLYGYSSKLPYC